MKKYIGLTAIALMIVFPALVVGSAPQTSIHWQIGILITEATATPTLVATPLQTATQTPTVNAAASLTPSSTATQETCYTVTATLSPGISATLTEEITIKPTVTCTTTPTRTMCITLGSTATTTTTEIPTMTCTAKIDASRTPSSTRTCQPTHTPIRHRWGQRVNACPNPSRGKVMFEYEVAGPGKVAIDIYKLTGERVASISEQVNGGSGQTLSTAWDAVNVAPGIYYCRVVVTDGSGKTVVDEKKKVAIIR